MKYQKTSLITTLIIMLKFSLSQASSFTPPMPFQATHKQSLVHNHPTSQKSFIVNDSRTNIDTSDMDKSSLPPTIIQPPMSPFNTGTMDIETSGPFNFFNDK